MYDETEVNWDPMQKWRPLISIILISLTHHGKKYVEIFETAKFQSCRPNTRGMADIWKNKKKKKKKQMYGSQSTQALLSYK